VAVRIRLGEDTMRVVAGAAGEERNGCDAAV
jgi:hypothetical protein